VAEAPLGLEPELLLQVAQVFSLQLLLLVVAVELQPRLMALAVVLAVVRYKGTPLVQEIHQAQVHLKEIMVQ
jgi:hypothetical protein